MIEPLESRSYLAAIKIMPLGDSITEGNQLSPNYRYYLWHDLKDAGYDVDFVGSMHGVLGGTPLNPDFDQDHEGHSGALAQEIGNDVFYWAQQNTPDIVLMHVGTNDARQHWAVDQTISWIEHGIEQIRRSNPNVTVLVAQIIPCNLEPQRVINLNAAIPQVAQDMDTSQSHVYIVNQWTGFNATTDTADGIHPDDSGDKKVADNWFATVKAVLDGTTPPAQPPTPDPTQIPDPPPDSTLVPPTAVKASPRKTWINLTWADQSTGETKFVVERKTWSTGTFKTVGEVSANQTKFTDSTNLVAGVKYYYRVSAVNSTGSTSSAATLGIAEATNPSVFATDLFWGKSSGATRDTVADAIYTSGSSSVLLQLDGQYSRLSGSLLLGNSNPGAPVHFKIYADGKKLFDTTAAGSATSFSVDVRFVTQLYLIVSDTNASPTAASWQNAKFAV